MKRGAPLRNKTPMRRKTSLRASNRFPSKGDPGAATAANVAVPVSLEALRFPKPAKKAKAPPKPIKRSWMRTGARGTKHSRRPRELGYMAFCHARGCELYLDIATQGMLGFKHHCQGRMEFAHLSDKKRYDVGDVGACLCQTTHRGIDGKVGGKAPWYVALDRVGQRMIRMRLADRARRDWDALTPEQRSRWDDVGELRRKELRAA